MAARKSGQALYVFVVMAGSVILAERQRCGTAEIGCPERSERGTLPAAATTVLFAVSLFVVRYFVCWGSLVESNLELGARTLKAEIIPTIDDSRKSSLQ